MARAVWNGAVVAESDDVTVVDGYTYFPAESVDMRFLVASDHHTVCHWKGTASYHDISVDGAVNRNAAWHYPQPSAKAAPLVAGRIGFWKGVKIERDDDAGDGRWGLLGRVADRLR